MPQLVIASTYDLTMFQHFICFNMFATPLLTVNFHSAVKLKNAYKWHLFNLLFSQKCVFSCFEIFFLVFLKSVCPFISSGGSGMILLSNF